MRTTCCISVFLLLTSATQGFSLQVPPKTAHEIGIRIWQNECGGKVDGLTHWNKGENFGSFGIGHFIWVPENRTEPFQDTFPLLLAFLKEQGAAVPEWLVDAKGCPWGTREEFYQEIESPRMESLRQFLLDTKDLQAVFMANRLQNAMVDIEKGLSEPEKKKLQKAFDRLSGSPQGLYALIDYANFKGMGTAPSEAYRGQGWGLKQVLLQISPSSRSPLDDFVAAAKKLLILRVENAPPERNEQRWLKGWLNRLDTYTHASKT